LHPHSRALDEIEVTPISENEVVCKINAYQQAKNSQRCLEGGVRLENRTHLKYK
jgi:hypothetical protein